MARLAMMFAAALVGAAVAAVLLIAAERLFFPHVHEAARREWFGEFDWPCCGVMFVGMPAGALLGGALATWFTRRQSA